MNRLVLAGCLGLLSLSSTAVELEQATDKELVEEIASRLNVSVDPVESSKLYMSYSCTETDESRSKRTGTLTISTITENGEDRSSIDITDVSNWNKRYDLTHLIDLCDQQVEHLPLVIEETTRMRLCSLGSVERSEDGLPVPVRDYYVLSKDVLVFGNGIIRTVGSVNRISQRPGSLVDLDEDINKCLETSGVIQ